MNQKLVNTFIDEVRRNNPNIRKEELEDLLKLFKTSFFKTLTPEEMVDKALKDAEANLVKYVGVSPGFTFGVKINNINVKLFGGIKDSEGNMMNHNTIFDIASITKLYTQMIIYSLINMGIISFDSKVSGILPEYSNLGDLTIRDITSFVAKFETDGRIDSKETIGEAIDCLKNVRVVSTGSYNYNDIGMMILKDVIEKITSKSYTDVLNEMISSRLGLNNTYIMVPFEKRNNITGSPNIKMGLVNDAKANALGGYSGHAGIWSSSDDLIKFGEDTMKSGISDLVKPGVDPEMAVMGNLQIKRGVFVDELASDAAFSAQGSTRTQLNSTKWNLDKEYIMTSTILLNPAICSLYQIAVIENEFNKTLINSGKKPIKIAQFFENEHGLFQQTDARYLCPALKTSVPLTKEMGQLSMRLLFIEYLVSKYDKNYKNIQNVERQVTR